MFFFSKNVLSNVGVMPGMSLIAAMKATQLQARMDCEKPTAVQQNAEVRPSAMNAKLISEMSGLWFLVR